MIAKHFILSVAAIFIFALAWNGIVHGLILKESEGAISGLIRPDIGDKIWLSILVTLAIAILFVFGYARWAKVGSMREGILYGLYFGLLAGLLVDVNQYVLYPIPASIALKWYVGGLFEFSIYGILVKWLFPINSGTPIHIPAG